MALLYRDQAGTRLRVVTWSPDGTRIASADLAGLAHVWPIA